MDPAKREIRLLHLAPSENIDDQPKCFLKNISLNDNPQYEALSYAWGDVKVTQPINLQDVQREITENLEAALRQLRGNIMEKVFWVDAVCIDQNSDEGKNYQVPLMRTIYSSAAMVRVWLGAGREGSDIAMLVLEKLCRGNPPRFANLRIDGKPLLFAYKRLGWPAG